MTGNKTQEKNRENNQQDIYLFFVFCSSQKSFQRKLFTIVVLLGKN